MTYYLKDVDRAEDIVRKECPDAIIHRGDVDWSLVVRAGDTAIILFQPPMDGQREIKSTPEEVKTICFVLGSQWTPEQIAKMKLN
jgi:hypothetical protein